MVEVYTKKGMNEEDAREIVTKMSKYLIIVKTGELETEEART